MPGTGAEHEARNGGVEVTNNQAEPDDSTLSPNDGGDPSSGGDDDGWGKAKEAWRSFKGGESDGQDADGSDYDDPDTSDQADGEDDSHLEADQADQPDDQDGQEPEPEPEGDLTELNVKYNLDDLPVPQKFKPRVQQKIDSILGDVKAQASKLNEGYKESNTAFARAFVDIIQSDNPLQTLYEYAEQAVPAFGMSQEVLTKLGKHRGGAPANGNGSAGTDGAGQVAPNLDVAGIQKRLVDEFANIEETYWPLLEKEQDPKKARELFSRMEREKMSLMNAVQTAQLKAVLTAFYGKLVKPQFDEFGKIKTETESAKATAQRTAKVSLWNSADKQMGGKFKDWPKYRTKVKELIKTEYDPQKKRANESGKGHLKLMQDLYLVVSRQDHLVAAKRPTRGPSGIKPSGKHIKTNKAGGSDWDDIKRNHWGDLIPDDE